MNDTPTLCHRCLAELTPCRSELFVVRIEAVADPSPPVITDEDLNRDLDSEINRLVNSLRSISSQEAMDQVYRRVTLTLCNACYKTWIEDPTGTHP